MSPSSTLTEERLDTLIATIARATVVSPSWIVPFTDFSDALTAVFELSHRTTDRIIVAGHATPEIAIAADRAGYALDEHLGTSPFAADPDGVIERCATGYETIYLANPNRVTGSNFGLGDLELIASAAPSGLVVVDEYYFDFYGITATRLQARYPNIVVVRSHAAAFGIASSDSGHLILAPALSERLAGFAAQQRFSTTLHRLLSTSLDNSEAKAMRVKLLNDEALRLSGELSALGIQCRISATDFILMRVADPTRVGNAFAKGKVAMLNLDGYPGLRHYVRYTLQSPLSNDTMVSTIKRMPADYYALDSID
ncbi:aminotransferase class I/II-fold pyridoxal phosphate-dependent enzyme, partial [candidate division GN15 bacterium]|nr:aminotransferase class I/II-fold pyridoxal phosphate-dependent enzyme [candidate division GN15 bacterium]